MVRHTFIQASSMALSLIAPAIALAQSPAASAPPAPVPSGDYRSAFEGYQAYSDEAVGNWKEVNDTVGKIGGWRVYAKEASGDTGKPQGEAARPVQPAPSAGSAAPAPGSAAPAGGHGKH